MGLTSVSIGTNEGSSWQYRGLLDLNGDRYPDLIHTSANGSRSAFIRPGTGRGFGLTRGMTLP